MMRAGEHNGQSWGKQILGIRVARDNGETVTSDGRFLREFVVSLPVVPGGRRPLVRHPGIVNYLWPLWDDENRCLHDMIVKSHVVRA